MATKTFYVVQPYVLGKRGALKAGQAREARSAADAERLAQRLSATGAGAIAFSREVDPESDDAEPPILIASYGRVPEGAFEAG
ncbi:hypothetical protein QOZ94_002787 [Xanthobacter agilis]|uniref:Uncharacterized protein n=1 Tax=Xanthobacter agilis TaxID=47492 RepID=A0ABU0LFS3_XANAG|nr:hypothetical protein [Xanthobacter agilis]